MLDFPKQSKSYITLIRCGLKKLHDVQNLFRALILLNQTILIKMVILSIIKLVKLLIDPLRVF
jgi:hypothetical protein